MKKLIVFTLLILLLCPYMVGCKQTPPLDRVRILISSDMHNTPAPTWYGTSNDERLQQWVDGIIAEHKKEPIDALVILGDLSLDYWAFPPYGYYPTTGVSYTKDFIERFVSALPSDFPVYFVPGNHEQYDAQTWLQITGQNRQTHFVIEDNLFILSDTYAGDLAPTTHHDGEYSGVDMDYLTNAVEENSAVNNIWLMAHGYSLSLESKRFTDFLQNDLRVRGLFMGHMHYAHAEETEYRGLTIAHTGNFSYTQFSVNEEAMKTTFWGYRELVIDESGAESNYIIPATTALLTGPEKTKIPYQKLFPVTYTF